MSWTRNAALLLMVACVNENEFFKDLPPIVNNTNRPVPNTEQTDSILQVTTPMVDVLWTIDNSCSMATYQDNLADNFPSFMDYFDGSGLDYHVGVVSTDTDNPTHSGKLQPGFGYKFIDSDTASPIEVFQEMATMGTNGSSTERGLGATFLGLEEHRDTFNAGLYRDEASVNTIVISDEPDLTQSFVITQPEFVDWYDGLKREGDMRSFSSIVDPRDGQRYMNSTRELGGINWDINTDDWSGVLERLGIQASGLKREYFLSQRPVIETIVVEVEDVSGALLPPFDLAEFDDVGNLIEGDYTYDPIRNSITFLEYVPNALSTVLITYTLDSSLQEYEEGVAAQ
jgi:hypothetical protein